MKFRKSRRSCRKGAAVVEAAVTLPIVLLVVMGTVEVCNHIFLQQSLSIIAYEGTRIALVPDSTLDDIALQVEEIAQLRHVENVNFEVSPSDFQTQPVGTEITVTASANNPCSIPIGLFSQEVSRSVTMLKEF